MALVRKIIPQSTVDGPGNRTAVFLQGCNIRCAYCHNPETQAMHDPQAKEMSVAQVLEEIQKGIPFIRGITVSGGECMLQTQWLTELFAAVKTLFCKDKSESAQTTHSGAKAPPLTCLIDSNGTIPFYRYPALMANCDGVMLDIKAWDKEVYSHLTQSPSNEVVKKNLVWLLQNDLLTEVRIVCVPGRVDVENILTHLAKTFNLIEKNGTSTTDAPISPTSRSDSTTQRSGSTTQRSDTPTQRSGSPTQPPVRLIRFRPQGVVGELAKQPMPTEEQMQHWSDMACALGLHTTVR